MLAFTLSDYFKSCLLIVSYNYYLGRSRASMRDRPLPTTPPSQPANQSNTPGGGAPGINPTHALQLQQYRQRLQQMHQQLSAGQNQLKELQKNPQENQPKVNIGY